MKKKIKVTVKRQNESIDTSVVEHIVDFLDEVLNNPKLNNQDKIDIFDILEEGTSYLIGAAKASIKFNRVYCPTCKEYYEKSLCDCTEVIKESPEGYSHFIKIKCPHGHTYDIIPDLVKMK